MTDIKQVLSGIGIPARYSHFKSPQAPPFIVYLGAGQEQFPADNTRYAWAPSYTVEFYFTEKDETMEDAIETALLSGGWHFSKGEDVWIESEAVFEIVYSVTA